MLVRIASRDAIPITPSTLAEGQREERRYLWATSGDAAELRIPAGYPRRLDGPVWTVRQKLTLAWAPDALVVPGEPEPTPDPALTFKFGWSDDGRHWVLFGGVNPEDPEDQRRMREFPIMLRNLTTDPGVVLTGQVPLTRKYLSEMKAAWAASDPTF